MPRRQPLEKPLTLERSLNGNAFIAYEVELDEELRLQLADLQLDRHKAIEAAMKEEQGECEIPSTDL